VLTSICVDTTVDIASADIIAAHDQPFKRDVECFHGAQEQALLKRQAEAPGPIAAFLVRTHLHSTNQPSLISQ